MYRQDVDEVGGFAIDMGDKRLSDEMCGRVGANTAEIEHVESDKI